MLQAPRIIFSREYRELAGNFSITNFANEFVFYLLAEEQDALQVGSSTAPARQKRMRRPGKCKKMWAANERP